MPSLLVSVSAKKMPYLFFSAMFSTTVVAGTFPFTYPEVHSRVLTPFTSSHGIKLGRSSYHGRNHDLI